METETHQGLRQREEKREGFPISGSPELGNSAVKGRELPGWVERAKQKAGGGMPGSSTWRMPPLTLLFTSESDPPVFILRTVERPTLLLSCIPAKSPRKPRGAAWLGEVKPQVKRSFWKLKAVCFHSHIVSAKSPPPSKTLRAFSAPERPPSLTLSLE